MYILNWIIIKISIKFDSVFFFQTESPSKTSLFINGEYFEFQRTSNTGLPQNPGNVILNIGKFLKINCYKCMVFILK